MKRLLIAGFALAVLCSCAPTYTFITINIPTPSKKGDVTTETVRLPVCYMQKCTDSPEVCAGRISSSFLPTIKRDLIWFRVSRQIEVVGSHQYYISGSVSSNLKARLAERWPRFGCYGSDGSTSEDEARLRLCLSEMPKWIQIADLTGIENLKGDSLFRKVCLFD